MVQLHSHLWWWHPLQISRRMLRNQLRIRGMQLQCVCCSSNRCTNQPSRVLHGLWCVATVESVYCQLRAGHPNALQGWRMPTISGVRSMQPGCVCSTKSPPKSCGIP